MSSANAIWPHDDNIAAYWVIPGRLLAGEYPGAKETDKAVAELTAGPSPGDFGERRPSPDRLRCGGVRSARR